MKKTLNLFALAFVAISLLSSAIPPQKPSLNISNKAVNNNLAFITLDWWVDNNSTSDVEVEASSAGTTYTTISNTGTLNPNNGASGTGDYDPSAGIDIYIIVTNFVTGTTRANILVDGSIVDNIAISSAGTYHYLLNTSTTHTIAVEIL